MLSSVGPRWKAPVLISPMLYFLSSRQRAGDNAIYGTVLFGKMSHLGAHTLYSVVTPSPQLGPE